MKKYWLLIKKIIEQTNFTYSPLGKAFKEQTKKLKIKERKKSEQLKVIIPMRILMKMNYCFQRKKIFKNIYNKRLDRIEELKNW